MKLTREQFLEIFGAKHVDLGFAEHSIKVINEYAEDFRITEPIHLVRFMAQCYHEIMFLSDGYPRLVENTNFRKKTLRRLSKYWRNHPDELEEVYAKKDKKTIMNKWYNGRMGNRVDSNDGWKFRGHFAIMVTGRETHQRIFSEIGRVTGKSLVTDGKVNKGVFKSYENFWLGGMGYWSVYRLDRCNHTRCVTKRVNGGLPKKEKEERARTAVRIKEILM